MIVRASGICTRHPQRDLNSLLPIWLEETARRMTSSKNPWGMDMISYMEAAAMLGLRHGISNKIMVSTVVTNCHQEAWELLPPAGGLGCPPTGGAGLKPVLHYCDFYSTCHEGVRKNPGYYFGKFEFSSKHGGKWGRVDPFRRAAIESRAGRRVE